MNYNDRNIHNNFYDEPIENLQVRARDYSEGNKDLEETLLNLWKQGVPTTSCCIGHEKKEDNDESGIGFFIFKLDNPKSTEFLNLLYIPDKILINMLRKITYKYNKILLLYNQTIELFINDQQELIKNNIITKIIFPSDFLNFDFNSFQFI